MILYSLSTTSHIRNARKSSHIYSLTVLKDCALCNTSRTKCIIGSQRFFESYLTIVKLPTFNYLLIPEQVAAQCTHIYVLSVTIKGNECPNHV